MNRLILISGGIGAGKSVVCRILSSMGYAVYDCDSRAKILIDRDRSLCIRIDEALRRYAAEPLIDSGCALCRDALAAVVFGNPAALKILNSIVHPAVLHDLEKWREKQNTVCFVESAIPSESGLRDYVDEEWIVVAPEWLRISRVVQRNGLAPEKVSQRIAAQQSEWLLPHAVAHHIVNDNRTSLLLQIDELLRHTDL